MNLPDTMRPGVFLNTSIRSALSRSGLRGGVVCVARAQGESSKVVRVTTLSQAEDFGEDSTLYKMVRTLLKAGAEPLYAVTVQDDYAAAFEAVGGLGDVRVTVCDGGAQELEAHIAACRSQGEACFGVVAVSESDAEKTARALNNPYICAVCDGGVNTHLTAAAFAAAVATADAQDSLNGVVLAYDGVFDGALTAGQVQRLLKAGVVPFEGGEKTIVCVRAVTTCTMLDGKMDRTFGDLSTMLAVDDVTESIRCAVKTRIRGMKNNAVTRESIASQITVELENKRMLGVIDSYVAPVVTAHAQDPGVCVATLAFRVAPEISQIVINSEIQV